MQEKLGIDGEQQALLEAQTYETDAGTFENNTLAITPEIAMESGKNPKKEKNKSSGHEILSLAIPALAGLAIDPLMTLADTAFVGRSATNSDGLAAIGSASAVVSFSFYIFNFLTTATTPLVASRRASGDERGALALGGQALTFALLLGSALCVLLFAIAHPLLKYVMGTGDAGPEANAYAIQFLLIRAMAAPAVLATSAATGILRGYLDTKTPVYILVVANIINFAIDVWLILGVGMGPTGAAIATTTAEWICAVCFLGILAGKLPSADGDLGSNQKSRKNEVKDEEKQGIQVNNATSTLIVVPSLSVPTWKEVRPLVIASSSVFLRTIVLQIALSGAAAMAARNTSFVNSDDGQNVIIGGEVKDFPATAAALASASLAAHQIALQLWILCSFVCDALAAASQALVADALGRNDASDVRSHSRTVFAYAFALGLLLSACLEVGKISGFLLHFFTDDAPTQRELSKLLDIIILSQPLNALVFAADGVLQGAAEFTYQAKSMALSVAITFLSFIFLSKLESGLGNDTLVNVWYSLILLQVMRGLTSLYKIVEQDGPIALFKNLTLNSR
uniref:Protein DETOXIFICATION n=2 Tax=Ditylum brightwellii TaxID=49249 RepID=A0A7S2EGU1_9STRA|mmetsp:Transcript_29895/g.44455  ORF Transcript_29895/g.44455 Transcript_29895/m.44455 type:complete len:567 (+) Transcript_29895:167-1867(+)